MRQKEKREYALKPTWKPQQSDSVAGVAVLRAPDGPKLYGIRFSERFEEFVGRCLRRGVSPYHPAYIAVTEVDGVWVVWAHYFGEEEGVVLWQAGERPTWLKYQYKGVSNGTRATGADGTGAGAGTGDEAGASQAAQPPDAAAGTGGPQGGA